MRIIYGHQNLPSPPSQGTAIGIGIFDGVHQGHQALLQQVTDLAERHGLTSVVYTFDPHPARLLRPELAPKLIEPLRSRLARFAQLGFAMALAATRTSLHGVLIYRQWLSRSIPPRINRFDALNQFRY
jgi:FAD synthase